RRGSERPDAQHLVSPTDPEWWRMIEALAWFHELAGFEAGRLDQEGDPAGAWARDRAGLRAADPPNLARTATGPAAARVRRGQRIRDWAADRRTTRAMIRRALDDVIACGTFRASETYTLQAEYLQLRQWLDGPANPGLRGPLMRLRRFFATRSYRLWPEQMQ